jgi:hypothetical protein
MQVRPVNFPIEDGQLLMQGEILCRERYSGDGQAPDEQKESRDEGHRCEANHRNKDESDDRAEWLTISLTSSISRPDEVFGRDNDRGYLCPSKDRSDTPENNRAVFTMLNIFPQIGDNNRGPWEKAERFERELANVPGIEKKTGYRFFRNAPVIESIAKTAGRF